MSSRAALSLAVLLFAGIAVARVLSDPHAHLLGWSGVMRGEYESWAWLDWWIPREAAYRVADAGGWLHAVPSLLRAPHEMGIGNWLDAWLFAIPCKALLGPVGGHNLHVLLVLLTNFGAAWLAVRAAQTTPDDGAAIVGALAIAANPITLWDIAESRFAEGWLAPLLLYFACIVRPQATLRWMLLAAAALALCALTWLFAPLLLLPLGVLACLHDKRTLLHLPLGAIIALLFLWPVVARPTTLVALGTPFPPLSGLTLPPIGTLGPPGPGLIVAYSVDASRPLQPVDGPALPWPWLLAAAVGAAMAWRSAGEVNRPGLTSAHVRPTRLTSTPRRGVVAALVACVAVWWIIALGPYLHWDGAVRDVPLPYQLLYEYVPFFSRLHWPARTLPFLWTAVVLLALPLLQHLTRRGAGVTFMLAVAAVLPAAAQGLWPLPATPLGVPAFYKSGVQGGVVEASLPWNANVAGALQSWHGQKVLGNLAHHPPHFGDADPRLRDPRLYGENAFLRALEQARGGTVDFSGAAAALPDIRAAGYRWVTVHRALPHAATVERVLQAVLERPPDVDEGGFAAWDIGP